jgi:hypothetical protein
MVGGTPTRAEAHRAMTAVVVTMVAVTAAIGSLAVTHTGTPAGATRRTTGVPTVVPTPSPPMIVTGGPAPRLSGAAAPPIRSENWSGYGVDGSTGSFSSAQGSFVVPAVTSCGATEVSAASFWVGIDGLASPTVEQDGVEVYCDDGRVGYFGWYEAYPQGPVVLSTVSVRPGDTVEAAVVSEGVHSGEPTYRLSVTDSTNGSEGAVVVSAPGAGGSSAECIAEDPGSTPVPYATYSSVPFSGCEANSAPIGDANPSAISMVTTLGQPEATPGPLQAGTSFTVTRATSSPASTIASTQAPPTATATATPAPAPAPLTGAVVGMASTPSGSGYWLANSAGSVSSHGGAVSYGSMAGVALDAPITHIVATSDGLGYWEVAADGGVFAFDAPFLGSTGSLSLARPIVSMAALPSGSGYWFVAADGGVFAFGASFYGSEGGKPLSAPIVGMAADATTGGYWLVGGSGTVYSFDAPTYGSD